MNCVLNELAERSDGKLEMPTSVNGFVSDAAEFSEVSRRLVSLGATSSSSSEMGPLNLTSGGNHEASASKEKLCHSSSHFPFRLPKAGRGDTPDGSRRFRSVLVLWFPKIYGLRKSLRQRSTSQPDGGSRFFGWLPSSAFSVFWNAVTGISAFLAAELKST